MPYYWIIRCREDYGLNFNILMMETIVIGANYIKSAGALPMSGKISADKRVYENNLNEGEIGNYQS